MADWKAGSSAILLVWGSQSSSEMGYSLAASGSAEVVVVVGGAADILDQGHEACTAAGGLIGLFGRLERDSAVLPLCWLGGVRRRRQTHRFFFSCNRGYCLCTIYA